MCSGNDLVLQAERYCRARKEGVYGIRACFRMARIRNWSMPRWNEDEMELDKVRIRYPNGRN